jgi:Alcohol dehydrogenase transcription factor Myb/SANT-like
MLQYVAGEKLRAKWNSVRSSFARELRAEKESAKSGSGKRKRAVYKYARNLAFLRPHMRLKNMLDNFNASTNEEVFNKFIIHQSL